MAQFTVTLTPNPAGPQPVGTSITWTATVNGDPDPNPVYEYRFSAEKTGQPVLVRRGFGSSNSFVWTPNAFEGNFTVGATVKNVHAGTHNTASATYVLTSQVTAGHAVVNPTSHPLVAFFSTNSCQVPNFMRVRFTPTTSVPPGGISSSQTTNLVPCRFKVGSPTPDNTSMNFYIAGMYPSTTYNTHWETVDPNGNVLHVGSDWPFTTGKIPSTIFFPTFAPMGTSGDPQEPIVLHSVITIPDNMGHIHTSAAVDLAGNVLWYAAPTVGPSVPPVRTETGGNYLGFSNPSSSDPYVRGIRESDPAGNPILETTLGAVNEQLAARGAKPITNMHHEVRRLTTSGGAGPHGYIMVIGNSEYICTNCQGGTPQNPVDLLYDQIIVMDNNMNVVWTWDASQFLDVNHYASLNEICKQPGGGGCEPFSMQFSQANDWLHSNALQYEPYDGSIIISSRHQDAVWKVNFANGTGDGHIIWELGNPNDPGVKNPSGGIIGGPGGTPLPTFTLTTNGAGGFDLVYPWFSHNHDPQVAYRGKLVSGSRIFTIFDDGNVRNQQCTPGFPFCDMQTHNSRCQEYSLDEPTLTANLNISGDMQSYSFALGASQVLQNGSISCDSGIIPGNAPGTITGEIDANSSFVYGMTTTDGNYRSFRMQDMYTAVNP
jgi:hypothetical protein